MFERRKSPPPEIGADNILRNDVEVTFKTFLEGVYAGRSKPFREAAFRIGYGIFRGGSTLLSSIVRAVHPDNRDPDRDKEMRERCSEWHRRLDGSWQPATVRYRVGWIGRTDKARKEERSEYRRVLMVESRQL